MEHPWNSHARTNLPAWKSSGHVDGVNWIWISARKPAPRLLGVVLARARRGTLRRVGLPEGQVLYAVDGVNRKGARVEREHEGAEHALVLVGVRFTSDVKVLDDRRVLDVVPVLRRR